MFPADGDTGGCFPPPRKKFQGSLWVVGGWMGGKVRGD